MAYLRLPARLGPRPATAHGFTLIEMMAVISISAILLAVAVPGMRSFMARNGQANSIHNLMGSITLARAEAIKRGTQVVMCRSTDADSAANPSCHAAGGWEAGWIVFADFNGDEAFDASDGDVLLRAQGSIARQGRITHNGGALLFRPIGVLSRGASRFEFETAGSDRTLQRAVCVSFGARARLTPVGSASCS